MCGIYWETNDTHIHGEEITGKAARLQRWEDKDYLHSLQGQQINISLFKV
jgi:hypothetical protein